MSSLALPPPATEADVVGNLTMVRWRARLPVKMRLGTKPFDAPSVAEAVMSDVVSSECRPTMPEERMRPATPTPVDDDLAMFQDAEKKEPVRTPEQASLGPVVTDS